MNLQRADTIGCLLGVGKGIWPMQISRQHLPKVFFLNKLWGTDLTHCDQKKTGQLNKARQRKILFCAFTGLTLFVGHQEEHQVRKRIVLVIPKSFCRETQGQPNLIITIIITVNLYSTFL